MNQGPTIRISYEDDSPDVRQRSGGGRSGQSLESPGGSGVRYERLRDAPRGHQVKVVLVMVVSFALFACTALGAYWVLSGDAEVPDEPLTTPEARQRRAAAILARVPLIDGHNDLAYRLRHATGGDVVRANLRLNHTGVVTPSGPSNQLTSHTDIPRLRAGKVGGQFWSVYVDCNQQYRDAVHNALEQVDVVHQIVAQHPDVFTLATTAQGVVAAHASGRVASLLGLEGGHMLGESLAVLRTFQRLGVRYVTLTHNCHTTWAESCAEDPRTAPPPAGLSPWGERVVRELGRLGVLVDLSHVSPATARAALTAARAPVIFSHSAAAAVCPDRRNVPDDVLVKTAENGGVVMVTFVPAFLSCTPDSAGGDPAPEATLDHIVAHIEHIRDIAGIDHVGIGSDFDGFSGNPKGLEDTSKFPNLIVRLLERGWDDVSIEKLIGRNILRVMEKSEEISRLLSVEPADMTPHDVTTLPDVTCRTTKWEF